MPWQGTSPLEASPYARQRAWEAFLLPYQARQAEIDRNNANADAELRANLDLRNRAALEDQQAFNTFQQSQWVNAWRDYEARQAAAEQAARDAAQFEFQTGRDFRQNEFQTGRDQRLFEQDAAKAGQAFQQNRALQQERLDWQSGQGALEHQRALERQTLSQQNQQEMQSQSLSAQAAAEAFRAQEQQRRDLFQEDSQARRDERQFSNQAERDQYAAFQAALRQRDQLQAHAAELRAQEAWKWDSYRQHEIAQGLQKGVLAYTPRQSQEIARLTDALHQVQTDDGLDDGQREAAAMGIRRKLDAIRPLPVPLDKVPVPLENRVRDSVHWDGGDWGQGTPWVIDPKSGMPQIPRGWKPPESEKPEKPAPPLSDKDRQHFELERAKQMHSYALGLMKQTRPEIRPNPDKAGKSIVVDVPAYTPDQAWDEAARRFPAMGGGAATQQAAPAAGQPSGSSAQPAAGGSVVERAIAAARSGDAGAQAALDKRGIEWRP